MRVSGFVLTVALGAFSCLSSVTAFAEKVPESGAAMVQQQPAAVQPAPPATPTDLDAVKTAFEAQFGGLEVSAIRKTPVAGLYEVQVGMELIYVDADVNYVLQGALIDANTRTDLTAARIQKLSEVPFESLPLDHAVKITKGDGRRKLAVFEDPNCIYCKQLHASLKDIDNITLYSFLLPILSADSVTKARDVWCASDSGAVWQAWMLDGKVPPTAQCDDDPVEQVLELGRQLMVRGTPAILFADGSRVNGTLPTDQLRLRLDALD